MPITPDQARQELAKRELARRGVSDQPKTDWKGVVGKSVKDMFQKPAAYAKDLGTNPRSMANVMPSLLGTAGALSPIPGGATMGTAAGQGIRDLSNKALGQPIPSGMQHAGELGLSALGDLSAIPAIKGKIFGKAIGEAEKGAGVIARGAEKAITPGSVGKTLRELEDAIDAGKINTPQSAKDAKEIVEQIYKNPKIYEKSNGISVQSQRVSAKVQKLLNEMIPGRAEPAANLARAMKIPNAMRNVYRSAPWPLRVGAQGAAGALGVDGLIKILRGQ